MECLYGNPTIHVGNTIGIKLQGLLGDTIRASTIFDSIVEQYPDHKWVVIHSYTGPTERLDDVREMMKPWFDNGRIYRYFIDNRGTPEELPEHHSMFFKECQCHDVFDLLIITDKFLSYEASKPTVYPPSKVGASESRKAVILRYSGFHDHFPERNRSVEEWDIMTQALLDAGYEVHLVGLDDEMPNNLDVVDHRGKLSVVETLQLANTASLCVSVASFLPVFTQASYKSLVLTAEGDMYNLERWWKYTDNYVPINVEVDNYLDFVVNQIKSS
jgi:hypothetical protein